MTAEQFIASVEAKPNFIRWAKTPTVAETLGEVEKHNGVAYISTPDGTNTVQVWFIVDTPTGQATWQTQDTLQPEKNTDAVKRKALETYLKANFSGYFINRADLVNNWAEADVFAVSGADLTKQTVLVFKLGVNPITHRKIV